MRRTTCVQFDQVSKRYSTGWLRRRAIQALEPTSLEIFDGDVFGIIGPNRAGKTTLVKILLSICNPTSGRLIRLGRDGRERATLARVGYVHERQAFPRYLTGRQLLHYYGAMSFLSARELRPRAEQLLNEVGLAGWGNRPIRCYSKGMVQRLALAQALLNNPDLLVLDEPSEGMDQAARKLIHDTVAERQTAGQTTILISHAMSEVERLCNRLAVLHAGRLNYCGPVEEFVRNESVTSIQSDRCALERAMEPLYAEALS